MNGPSKYILLLGIALMGSLATAVDIPTWQVGDSWDFTESFDVEASYPEEDIQVTLETDMQYTLDVESIGDRTSDHAGMHRVYARVRSDGMLSGDGEGKLGDITLNLRWKEDSTVDGEVWTRVSDLALVRERFVVDAGIEAQVFFAWVDVADITLTIDVEFDPPLEIADFPIDRTDETWSLPVSMSWSGAFDVAFGDAASWGGEPVEDLNDVFGGLVDHLLDFVFTGLADAGSFDHAYRLVADPLLTAFYEPSIEEFARYETDLFDFGDFGGLRNFTRRVTDYHLQSDAAFDSLVFIPSRPLQGDSVTLNGLTDASTLVSARIGNRALGSAMSDAQGAFALTFTAPGSDDDSPASEDDGSFGVELEASGVGRSVVTLQLDPRRSAVNPLWTLYF